MRQNVYFEAFMLASFHLIKNRIAMFRFETNVTNILHLISFNSKFSLVVVSIMRYIGTHNHTTQSIFKRVLKKELNCCRIPIKAISFVECSIPILSFMFGKLLGTHFLGWHAIFLSEIFSVVWKTSFQHIFSWK